MDLFRQLFIDRVRKFLAPGLSLRRNQGSRPLCTPLKRAVWTLLAASLTTGAGMALAAAPGTADEPPEAAAQNPVPEVRQGTFKGMHGEVTVVSGSSRRAALPGGAVYAGDQIITGRDSSASLVLIDGTTVALAPDSAFALQEYAFEANTKVGNMLLLLLHGSLRIVSGQISKSNPDQVKITTPTSIIGVRGTDFIVEQAR